MTSIGRLAIFLSTVSLDYIYAMNRNELIEWLAYYLKSAGFGNVALLLGLTIVYSFSITYPQYWVKSWTEGSPSDSTYYMIGYVLLAVTAWVSTNGMML